MKPKVILLFMVAKRDLPTVPVYLLVLRSREVISSCRYMSVCVLLAVSRRFLCCSSSLFVAVVSYVMIVLSMFVLNLSFFVL